MNTLMAVARGVTDKVIEATMRVAKEAKSGMLGTLNTTGRKNPSKIIPANQSGTAYVRKNYSFNS